MPYKEELLKKIEELRKYQALREQDPETALKIKTYLPALETGTQVAAFFRLLNNQKQRFGGKDQYKAFIDKHPDLFPDGKIPMVSMTELHGIIRVPDADYAKILEALEEEFKDKPEELENLYKECAVDIRAKNYPLTDLVNNIKKDVDTLYEDEALKKELKEALDYANGEMVEKTGPNLLDSAIDANSVARTIKARRNFPDFVQKNEMDTNKVANQSPLITVISPGLTKKRENYQTFKPFFDMEVTYDQDYKNKLLQLDQLCQEEGLLTQAAGGESGFKEYGLSDYFQKNYALKKALTDYGKLEDGEAKKAALANIKNLTDEVKTVTAKYDKVLSFIEKNFDLDNIDLPGNLYSGRSSEVPNGNLENWRPNLPPKFDFEKSPAVIFLSGFTQMKAASQFGDVSLQEYLENPKASFLKGAKKAAAVDEAKIYLPRSEENSLGKRMAHVLLFSSQAYEQLAGYGMMGGRGLEFLYNTSPNDENTNDNVIKSGIFKEYHHLYDRNPGRHFGLASSPDINKLKNLFVAGEETDKLCEVSPDYVNEKSELACIVKDYAASVKTHGNTPVDQEYRRIIKAIQDCCQEQEAMGQNLDQYLKGPKDQMFHFSHGAVLCAGRQYFVDYLKENNLSLASVQDDALRQEISEFMANPVQTFNDKHFHFPENGVESLDEVQREFNAVWKKFGSNDAESFMEKFQENNHKPNGYNAGKNIATILHDNRGGWWERFRGTTSKEYIALQKAAAASIDPESPTCGDKEAMYACAKAYRAYKLPEGRNFNSLSKTAKKRIEFCDSIINAYEAEKQAKEAVNNPQPVAPNNHIINQNDFQHQLQNDLGPKENNADKVKEEAEPANEKDPPENNNPSV